MVAFVVSVGTGTLSGKSEGKTTRMQAAAMDKAAVEKALMANEQKVNDAFQKKDVATFKRPMCRRCGSTAVESGWRTSTRKLSAWRWASKRSDGQDARRPLTFARS